jgi:hypothetical protein
LEKKSVWKKNRFGKKIGLEKKSVWKKNRFGKKIGLEKNKTPC